MVDRTPASLEKHPGQDFLTALNGQFIGLLRWEQFDALQATLNRDPADWFVYYTNAPPPQQPHSATTFRDYVNTLFARLRADSPNSCSFIYADTLTRPTLVKIYHPKKLIACSISSAPPLPAWIFSKLPPVEITREPYKPISRWKRLRLFFKKRRRAHPMI